MKLPIRPEAVLELDAAMAHYEAERPGLGFELLDAVEETVAFAAESPTAGPRRPGPLAAHETRRFVVRRFPYLVYVARIGERWQVAAIAHASRRPGYWQGRLE